ncbi:cytochrome P450 3A5 [Immersiella caudata]|uniref:Cytochrome P450 3A5 n=1 Tax=Immersiella caudata TaxID=314043 RepID=A0AA39WNX6_9PEZI|nr:cytochrome P450 3A5 [Immersiella caudata]
MYLTPVLHQLFQRLWHFDVPLVLLGILLLRRTGPIFYRLFIYPYFASPLRHLPGPKNHHFLIGQTLNQFRSGHPNEPFVSWMRKWPEAPLIRYFDVGNGDAILITGIEAHKEILHDNVYSFQKPPFFVKLIADIVGFGIGFAEGEEHKKQRRSLAALFATKNLEGFIPLLQNKARRLSQLLDDAIKNDGGELDIVALYSKITLDIMGQFALGRELDELTTQPPGTNKGTSDTMPFHACYHELFEPDRVGQLLVAINSIFPIRWLPIESNRRFKLAHKTLRNQIQSVIQQRIQELDPNTASQFPAENPNATSDLLIWMITKKYYSSNPQDRWTAPEIRDQLLTFLAAGHQTTADALTWATFLLTQHPSEAQRLRDELSSSSLPSNSDEPLTYRALNSLPRLHNFTREVLRVHCPGINVARQAIHDVVIQGTLIPKGTTVLMQPAIIHKNPTIWGDDCDEFRPDRWEEMGEEDDAWKFAAFSHGPRICIGRTFSMLEFKVLMVEIVRGWRFARVEGDERGAGEIKLVNPSPMLRPDGGLRVRVERAEPV